MKFPDKIFGIDTTFVLLILLALSFLLLFAMVSHPFELDIVFQEHNDINNLSIVSRETFDIKGVENRFRYAFYNTSDTASQTEIGLNSVYRMKDINIAAKSEYYMKEFSRLRLGAGINKEFGIFSVSQYIIRDINFDGIKDNSLLDTALVLDYKFDRFGLYYKYAFLTSFGNINYKYINFRLSNYLTDTSSIALEVDKRYEDVRSDTMRLLYSLKI